LLPWPTHESEFDLHFKRLLAWNSDVHLVHANVVGVPNFPDFEPLSYVLHAMHAMQDADDRDPTAVEPDQFAGFIGW
jgi:hypothetical protein